MNTPSWSDDYKKPEYSSEMLKSKPCVLAQRPFSASPYMSSFKTMFLSNTKEILMSSVLEQTGNATVFDELKELETSRDGLQVLISHAQSELDSAKAKQKISGEYADAEWFAKTRALIREETVELHNINRRIKTLRSQRSRSNPKAAFFQDAARKVLTTEQYNEINGLANKMMKE